MKKKKPFIVMFARIPRELAWKLELLSEVTKESKNQITIAAIESYIEDYPISTASDKKSKKTY